ncbi:MAG: nucleotidyltransferase domain-containing protein [Nitrospirae bacterium]|nr:nucleotidyltransferase domain-containing protein [Nitrospirota bacterium]MCL5237500.1 nucleotidyltransferase domain-containing protein [Nitrospirota bacterium]
MQTTGTLDTINLNYNEQVGLKGIIGDLTRRYAFIKRIILYGSKARGDFTEDSDIDLLFVTDRENPRSVKFKIYDIIHKYEVDNDIVVSAIFVSESDFETKVSLFIRSIKREGIVLWSID